MVYGGTSETPSPTHSRRASQGRCPLRMPFRAWLQRNGRFGIDPYIIYFLKRDAETKPRPLEKRFGEGKKEFDDSRLKADAFQSHHSALKSPTATLLPSVSPKKPPPIVQSYFHPQRLRFRQLFNICAGKPNLRKPDKLDSGTGTHIQHFTTNHPISAALSQIRLRVNHFSIQMKLEVQTVPSNFRCSR